MTNDNDSENASMEKYQSLWDEYKYRHDLIWQRTFTFTTAITLISTIPYIRPEIGRLLGSRILIAPLLAYLLAAFGLLVMHNELALFGKIKRAYRQRQNRQLGQELHDTGKRDTFRIYVTAYFAALVVLSILNFCIVRQIWLPAIMEAAPACPCP